MGEAVLGPGETSRELAEHAHGHGRAGTRHDRAISIVEAGLLAVVALLAAWSGYAAALWSTESRLHVAEAATTRNEANTLELEALDLRLGDALVFNSWLTSHALGDPTTEAVALRRFRPNLREAFDQWWATEPDTNPDAPAGPQAMPAYEPPNTDDVATLKREATSLFERGEDQGKDADKYVRTTVYLASVLFLVGISTQFPVRTARYGLLGVGGVILVFAVIQLVTLPKPV
jgi:hypothetical protein